MQSVGSTGVHSTPDGTVVYHTSCPRTSLEGTLLLTLVLLVGDVGFEPGKNTVSNIFIPNPTVLQHVNTTWHREVYKKAKDKFKICALHQVLGIWCD